MASIETEKEEETVNGTKTRAQRPAAAFLIILLKI